VAQNRVDIELGRSGHVRVSRALSRYCEWASDNAVGLSDKLILSQRVEIILHEAGNQENVETLSTEVSS
jgi:hypothetical protein